MGYLLLLVLSHFPLYVHEEIRATMLFFLHSSSLPPAKTPDLDHTVLFLSPQMINIVGPRWSIQLELVKSRQILKFCEKVSTCKVQKKELGQPFVEFRSRNLNVNNVSESL